MATKPRVSCHDPFLHLLQATASVLDVLAADPETARALTAALGKGWENQILGSLNDHLLRSGKTYGGGASRRRCGGQDAGGLVRSATKTLVMLALVAGVVATLFYAEHATTTVCRPRSLYEKHWLKMEDNSSTYYCLTTSTITLTSKWVAKVAGDTHHGLHTFFGPGAVFLEAIGAVGLMEWKLKTIRTLLSHVQIHKVADELVNVMEKEKITATNLRGKVPAEARQKIYAEVEQRLPQLLEATQESVASNMGSGVASTQASTKRTRRRVPKANKPASS